MIFRQANDPIATAPPNGRRPWASTIHELLGAALPVIDDHQARGCSKRPGKQRSVHIYIIAKSRRFRPPDQLVISIDAEKKGLVGEFKNGGRTQGQPIEVSAHEFEHKELGKIVPYGSPTTKPA